MIQQTEFQIILEDIRGLNEDYLKFCKRNYRSGMVSVFQK